jgi:hypothetical protein
MGGLSNTEQVVLTSGMNGVSDSVMLMLEEQRRTNQLLELALTTLTQGAPIPPRPEPVRLNWRGKPKS